jgi:type IX secretion system PorP/SprF family membrane protein
MKGRLFISILFLFIVSAGFAQDIHFSQYFNSPLLVNPSLIGNFNGRGRLIINYRDQWNQATSKPYKTFAFSYDHSFSKDVFAAGVQFFQDKAGNANFGLSQVNINIASKVQITGHDFIKLGLQGAWSQYSLNLNNLTWNSQFDGNVINPDIHSGELNYEQSVNYFDCSTGLLWIRRLTPRTDLKIGVSAYHLTHPVYNFWGDRNSLYVRWHIHGEIGLPLGKKLLIYPSFIAMFQGPSKEINLGASFRYTIVRGYLDYDQGSSVLFGAYYRNNDAIIAYTQINYQNKLNIGISYDVTISRLSKALNYQGGFELSVTSIIPNKVKKKFRRYRF